MQTGLADYGTPCICQQRCLSDWLVGEDSDASRKFAHMSALSQLCYEWRFQRHVTQNDFIWTSGCEKSVKSRSGVLFVQLQCLPIFHCDYRRDAASGKPAV